MPRQPSLVLALSLFAVPATAQIAASQSTLGDTLLVDHALTGVTDSFRIRLVEGGQYLSQRSADELLGRPHGSWNGWGRCGWT